jgi:hypothetical protein
MGPHFEGPRVSLYEALPGWGLKPGKCHPAEPSALDVSHLQKRNSGTNDMERNRRLIPEIWCVSFSFPFSGACSWLGAQGGLGY